MRDEAPPIIVMDLEWTAWDGSRARFWTGPGEEMEIVQIGAVKLTDAPGLPEIDHFDQLVRPRINRVLDPYFLDLTGITQDQVDRDGLDLKDALVRLAEFVEPATDILGFGDEVWHLVQNCQLFGMRNPVSHLRGISVSGDFKRFLGEQPITIESGHLPRLMDFDAPGHIHQGLTDARCIAEGLRRLRGAGEF